MALIIFLLKCAWLMMPAYFANMAPVFAARFEVLGGPIDRGKKFRGEDLFGKNKTWRGFAAGILAAVLVFWAQSLLYSLPLFREISLIDYPEANFLAWGFLFGFGALFGDLAKSFFKRRMKIRPGEPWIPFDQLDFAVGALALVSLVYVPPRNVIIAALAISFVLHILVNYLGYLLKIRKIKR